MVGKSEQKTSKSANLLGCHVGCQRWNAGPHESRGHLRGQQRMSASLDPSLPGTALPSPIRFTDESGEVRGPLSTLSGKSFQPPKGQEGTD